MVIALDNNGEDSNFEQFISNLWDHQIQSIQEVEELVKNGARRIMVQQPTGGGKTETAIAFAWKYLREWDELKNEFLINKLDAGVPPIDAMSQMDEELGEQTPIVWLTDRQELNRQTAQRFGRYGLGASALTSEAFPASAVRNKKLSPSEAVRGYGGFGTASENLRNKVMTISPQVFLNRFDSEQFNERSLMFVDEAHHAFAPTWRSVIQNFPGIVIGLSATPERVNPKEALSEVFEEIVQTVQIKDLEDKGVLLPVVVHAPPYALRAYGTRLNAGDYVDMKFRSTGSEAIFLERAVEYVMKHDPELERITLWYTFRVQHAIELAREFCKWIPAEKIGVVLSRNEEKDKEQSEGWLTDREEIYEKVGTGECRMIINVMVYTEGVDLPKISRVVTTRPTISPIVWNQQIGRGRRPDGEFDYLEVIDFVENTDKLGHPSHGRVYDLHRRNPLTGTRSAPQKSCNNCGAICYASSHKCPECGWAFGKECPKCFKFQPWRNWAEGSKTCYLCQNGALAPLMSVNGFNDHLKEDILRVSFHHQYEIGNRMLIRWVLDREDRIYNTERLIINQKGEWEWHNDDPAAQEDVQYYCRILSQDVSVRSIKELYDRTPDRLKSKEGSFGLVDRLIELGLIDENTITRMERYGIENMEPDTRDEELIAPEPMQLEWAHISEVEETIKELIDNAPEPDDEWMDIFEEEYEPPVDYEWYTEDMNWSNTEKQPNIWWLEVEKFNLRVMVGYKASTEMYAWRIVSEDNAVATIAKRRMKNTKTRMAAVRQSYDVLVDMIEDGTIEEDDNE